jgi:hypothetical protein
MHTKSLIFVLLTCLFLSCSSDDTNNNNPNTAEDYYFPPINSNTWETISPADIGWNTLELDELHRFFRRP